VRRLLLTLALAGTVVLVVGAQQPAKPDLPPINVNNARLVAASAEQPGPLTGVVFHDDKGLLVAGCEDGTLRLWKAAPDKEPLDKDARGEAIKAHERVVTAVAIGGTTLVTGSTDGQVRLWNLPPDKPTQTIKAAAAVRAVAVSADGKVLASGGDDNAVQLYDGAGKPTRKLTGPGDWVLAVALSPDGKTVAAGGHDGKLWAWDTSNGNKRFEVPAQAPAPAKTPAAQTNVVAALAFSPDGKQIALGGSDGRVHLFGASDGKFLRQLQGHTSGVTALLYHPAGAVLISASKDRTIRLWNPQAGNPLRAPLEGHTAWVQGLALARKGTKLFSASADRTVRLWDLGAPPPKPNPKKK
jgi:WD40 repeat protein